MNKPLILARVDREEYNAKFAQFKSGEISSQEWYEFCERALCGIMQSAFDESFTRLICRNTQ